MLILPHLYQVGCLFYTSVLFMFYFDGFFCIESRLLFDPETAEHFKETHLVVFFESFSARRK